MNELLELSFRADTAGWRSSLVSVLLAIGLSQLMAGVYLFTFRGLSYSRSFVQGMVLGSVVSCMLMLAVGTSVAAGLGIAGGLSVIRFRTTMRDPRDMVFVFGALAVGIAAGLQAWAASIVGTGLFALTALIFHMTSFGSRLQFDGMVRFTAPPRPDVEIAITNALRRHTRSFVLVTLREAAMGDLMEHAYQVSLADPDERIALVADLQSIQGLTDVNLLLQEPTLEL